MPLTVALDGGVPDGCAHCRGTSCDAHAGTDVWTHRGGASLMEGTVLHFFE
jgi:hypothetical protein